MTIQLINTQVALPTNLYQSLQKRAEQKGHSLNDEIVTLLMTSLSREIQQLEQEFDLWETASDENWISLESRLTKEG